MSDTMEYSTTGNLSVSEIEISEKIGQWRKMIEEQRARAIEIWNEFAETEEERIVPESLGTFTERLLKAKL